MNTQLDDLRSLAMIVYMHVYMHYYNGLPSSKRTCFTSQEMVNRPISVQGYCLTKGGMGSKLIGAMPKYVDGTLFIKGLPVLLNMNHHQSHVVQEDISHLEINAAPLQTRFQILEEKMLTSIFGLFIQFVNSLIIASSVFTKSIFCKFASLDMRWNSI